MQDINSDPDYALKYITHICKEYGERPPASEAEKKAAEDVKNELNNFCDESIYDNFKVTPGLYPQGLVKLAVITVVVGLFFFPMMFPLNIIAFIGAILGLIIFFTSLFLMKEWFGFFFKKGTSQNILGKILPRDEKGNKISGKKKIIIAGHLDSAYEMKIVKYQDNIAKITFTAVGYIGMVLLLSLVKSIILPLTSSVVLVSGSIFSITYFDVIFFIITVPLLPLLIFVAYCYTGNTKVMGANDNLSGVGVSLAVGKYFSNENNRLRNVELWVGTFGSEECGERGSNAFVKKYGKSGDLDNAYAIIPESCGAGSQLAILTEEKMHFVKHNEEVYSKLFKGYEKYKELKENKEPNSVLPCHIASLPFAASDAGRFSLAGYKATTILAYDGKIMKPANWHAITDTPENLNSKYLNSVVEIIKNYVILVENEEKGEIE